MKDYYTILYIILLFYIIIIHFILHTYQTYFSFFKCNKKGCLEKFKDKCIIKFLPDTFKRKKDKNKYRIYFFFFGSDELLFFAEFSLTRQNQSKCYMYEISMTS